jgi:hypothetical protein
MAESMFTRVEVEEMEKRTVDRVIDDRSRRRKGKNTQRMWQFLSMHDLYRNWTTATLSEVGKRFGDEVLEQIMTEE